MRAVSRAYRRSPVESHEPSPRRLHRASWALAGLAGATAALLGSFGWHLYREGSPGLALAVGAFTLATVACLMLVALAGCAMADGVERADCNYRRSLREVEERLSRVERRVERRLDASGIGAPAEPDPAPRVATPASY